jgi:hypothetical protein
MRMRSPGLTPRRAHIELQRATGHLLEARGNGVAVQRPERIQRLKDHQVECALQNVGLDRAALLDMPMEYHCEHQNVKRNDECGFVPSCRRVVVLPRSGTVTSWGGEADCVAFYLSGHFHACRS